MHRRSFARTESRRRRLAFTLIELLVVIMIIGILTALLMAGFSSAITAARVAAVVAEIGNLEKAIADFKLEYGIDPPSYFVLYEDGEHYGDTDSDAASHGHPSPRRSREIIRKLWPEYLNTSNQAIDPSTGDPRVTDFNHDGDTDDFFILNGAECLVFFLGGRWTFEDANANATYDAGERVFAVGFSSNPANPFEITATQSNRTQFYDFDPGRLADGSDLMIDLDGDLMPEFVDPIPSQTAPYLYFSSYDGAGYRPLGLDSANPADDETITQGTQTFDVYFQTAPTATTPGRYWNQNSFQIISPGFDAEYGAGGLYNGERAATPAERDNITNFKGSRLN